MYSLVDDFVPESSESTGSLIVPSVVLQTPSAPWVLSLVPPLGTSDISQLLIGTMQNSLPAGRWWHKSLIPALGRQRQAHFSV